MESGAYKLIYSKRTRIINFLDKQLQRMRVEDDGYILIKESDAYKLLFI